MFSTRVSSYILGSQGWTLSGACLAFQWLVSLNPALYLDEGPCAPRMMDSAAYTVVTIAVG